MPRARATVAAHYENFPVASLLLPRQMRPHVAALYAFARAADDFADEGDRTVEERHRLLDLWQCPSARRGRRHHVHRAAPAGTGGASPHAGDLSCPRCHRSQAAASVCAAGGSAERVPAGRDGHAVRDLAGAVRLLPALRQPDRPSGSSHRRLRGRRSRSLVGRDLHRTAAHQLLAGRQKRLRAVVESTFRSKRCRAHRR